MIVELAQLTIVAGRETEFESVFRSAISTAAASHGYLAHELRRSIESPDRYMLRIEWETLEDHTVGFRGSPAFTQWRAQVGPFFASAPVVEHFAPVTGEEG
jgi:heme-degrading monooxygenase HmoA